MMVVPHAVHSTSTRVRPSCSHNENSPYPGHYWTKFGVSFFITSSVAHITL